MTYSKVAAQILKNFYRGNKVLMDTSDPNAVWVCLDTMLLVRFPEEFFPFNSGMFENANLYKIIEGVYNDHIEAVRTRRIYQVDKKQCYELFAENTESYFIDCKLLDMLELIEPVFYVSTKSRFAPVLIYEEQMPDVLKAAICPVNWHRWDYMRKQSETFFRSAWCGKLTKLDGECILNRLKKEKL